MLNYYSRPHICQCLTRLATVKRNSVVTISADRQKSGHQFVEDVLSLACGLLQLGLRSGDVVAISAFNSDEYLEWLLAVAYVGGIFAPLNYRWSFKEASFAMSSLRPMLLVTDESCNHWYSELQSNAIPSLKFHISLGPSSTDFLKTQKRMMTTDMLKKHHLEPSPLDYSWASEDAVIICFTSGSTGKPKGVVISHSAIIVQSLAKVAIVGYNETDVYLHTAPLCHIGGLSSAMAILMVGASHVLIPKFDTKSAVNVIEQHHVTSFITVPTMIADFIALIRTKENWKGRSTVKKILNGGGSLSLDLIKDAIKCFPGAKLFSAYGMTETCSSLTFMTLYDPTLEPPDQLLQTYGTKYNAVQQPRGVCVGMPAPHVELKICSDDSSPVGKILTRGPHVMLKYCDQDVDKSSNSSFGFWFDTGDIGSISNDGKVWLTGRENGRIKSGGENVYPEEVEVVLLQHPGVIASVIVGIPDTRLTEMVVACVKLREHWQWSNDSDGGSLTGNKKLVLSREILRQHCREKKLTGFKIPKIFILWMKPFPLTTTGKIRRGQIQTEVMTHLKSRLSNL